MNKNKIDFIGIGAGRSGTAWLGNCLEKHPEIGFSSQESHKELKFFNDPLNNMHYKVGGLGKKSNYKKGLNWYLNQFPNSRQFKIRGEIDPRYLDCPKAAKRIKNVFPNVKIIVSLRNPVERAYSLYWYRESTIRTDMPTKFSKGFKNLDNKFIDFLNQSKYYEKLLRYYSQFPRNNIHVILFDDIKNNKNVVLKNLYIFLKVNPSFIPNNLNKKINATKMVRFRLINKFSAKFFELLDLLGLDSLSNLISGNNLIYLVYEKINLKKGNYPVMSKKIRKKLTKYYKEDIKKTEKLINRDLSGWLSL